VDWERVGIGSPLKADDNWARQTREKAHVSSLSREIPLSTKYRYCCVPHWRYHLN
jgi:hypothetical protein